MEAVRHVPLGQPSAAHLCKAPGTAHGWEFVGQGDGRKPVVGEAVGRQARHSGEFGMGEAETNNPEIRTICARKGTLNLF